VSQKGKQEKLKRKTKTARKGRPHARRRTTQMSRAGKVKEAENPVRSPGNGQGNTFSTSFRSRKRRRKKEGELWHLRKGLHCVRRKERMRSKKRRGQRTKSEKKIVNLKGRTSIWDKRKGKHKQKRNKLISKRKGIAHKVRGS